MNFTATIKNVGKVASPYLAMLFANTSNAGPAPFPNKWLVGFDRLPAIEPGHSAELDIAIPIAAIARANERGEKVVYHDGQDATIDFKTTTREKRSHKLFRAYLGSPWIVVKDAVLISLATFGLIALLGPAASCNGLTTAQSEQ
ncbi:putative exo-1,4-beta-xylosidase xlnD [Cladobotryum mycophilum]|uniref:Exo-1,4-beta-xylosidase xlnD n=1 Tax=Cladobotryum mycophilum TaxID=491253 RepID=A0ABR0SW43_9HYPO